MVERQSMDVDIVCVGFGPAAGGFLTTLSKYLTSGECPTFPQVICYERADDIAFGVSGVVTRARGIRASFPELEPSQIPMASAVKQEKVLYLLDPHGASRRSAGLKAADVAIRALKHHDNLAVELPYTPDFLQKHGGLVMSIGQFNQWVGSQLMGAGAVQIWPGMPAATPLIEDNRVMGIRLADQGPDMPGMDLHAGLTVVADGPVGAIGRRIDEHFGLPDGHHQQEWAVGMKMVVELRDGVDLEPGTVFHTFGYPEPEIFGFLYVNPDRLATAGIFVPSWYRNPTRTSYRYLQHFIMHPYFWRYLQGGKLRSWGAKSLQESGRRGEPFLVGDGYARIGEGSGSTNVLTGSGVDEAWTTGSQLGEGVIELMKEGAPFTKENLERAYVSRRRASWVETEGRIAEKARDGFHNGVLTGMVGMAMAGFSKGKWWIPGEPGIMPNVDDYYRGRLSEQEIVAIRREADARGIAAHDELMSRCGWPEIPYDGELLVSHQDALLMGGKVQAPPGYADHVTFLYPDFCERCGTRTCIEICSAEAIRPGENGLPVFDREKCVHCGACFWNCTHTLEDDPPRTNIRFSAGAGGLHSAEN